MDKTKALLALLALGLVAVLVVGAGQGGWSAWRDGPDPKATAGDGQNTMAATGTKTAGDAAHAKAAATTAAEEGDREEIATRHSEQQRKILLRFGCETLRHNVTPVWRYMKLRVRIADETNLYLAECT